MNEERKDPLLEARPMKLRYFRPGRGPRPVQGPRGPTAKRDPVIPWSCPAWISVPALSVPGRTFWEPKYRCPRPVLWGRDGIRLAPKGQVRFPPSNANGPSLPGVGPRRRPTRTAVPLRHRMTRPRKERSTRTGGPFFSPDRVLRTPHYPHQG